MATITVCGDLCPINQNLNPLHEGNVEAVFNDLLPMFMDSDLVIGNLECPLITAPTPVRKNGPNLGVPAGCAEGLRKAGFHALGIANNHIMDHGSLGLYSTIQSCEAAGLAVFGAGTSPKEAGRLSIRDIDGIRIGLLAMAEDERCLVKEAMPGANPFSPIHYIRTIRKHKDDFDFLIVLLHAGREGYPYPSPKLRDACRFLVEEGAGAVFCQHSHRIGCYELYRQGLIVYGQGNFLFDYPSHGIGGREGLMVQIQVRPRHPMGIRFESVQQRISGVGIGLADADSKTRILDAFNARSVEIARPGFVEEQWERHCATVSLDYFNKLMGFNRIMVRLNKNGLLLRQLYNLDTLLQMNNCIQCESHREVLLTAMENFLLQSENKLGRR